MNKLLLFLCLIYTTLSFGQLDSTHYYLKFLQYKKSINYLKKIIKKNAYIKYENGNTTSKNVDMINLACIYSLNKDYENAIFQLNEYIKSKSNNSNKYIANEWSSNNYNRYIDPDFYRVSIAVPKKWKDFLIKHKNLCTNSDTIFKKLNMNDSTFIILNQIGINDQAHYREISFYESKYGNQSSTALKLWKEKDSLNKANLKLVLYYLDNGYNVLSDSVVGKFAKKCFLVIQHADFKTQERMLPIIKNLYERKLTSGENYALLYDRVSVDKKDGKQYYGTQIDSRINQPYYIIDEKNVDARRASLGMESLKEYCKRMDIIYNPKWKK